MTNPEILTKYQDYITCFISNTTQEERDDLNYLKCEVKGELEDAPKEHIKTIVKHLHKKRNPNEVLTQVELKSIPKGEFFKLTETARATYVRDEYCRTEKKFECYKYEDCNAYRFLKGSKKVFVGFEI